MKKILMITRKVDLNDPLTGFVYRWVRKLGENLDKIYVITWQESDKGELPDNIEVISLTGSKLNKILKLRKEIKRIKNDVSGIFCHMNPEYTIITRLFFRGRIVSWYTHKAITWRRRLMEIFANKIVTASKTSFRDPKYPQKLEVLGHGIDTDWFFNNYSTDIGKILTVGRISPTKDYESMIKAVDNLVDEGISNIELKIVGAPVMKADQNYFENLKKMVQVMNLLDKVKFTGGVKQAEVVNHLKESSIFINMSGTGSLDKAVLEAMACGCLVLTSNEAFKEILPEELMVEKNNPKQLAEKIKYLMDLPEDQKQVLRNKLREEIVQNHNLDNLVKKIIGQF